eukprot:TRINITY_DN15206_c0_g3_i1.p1 TRINITY_DN15206_c0_g3~~TRINITY_DN15206_c0_g3_i1.p1  ORF type:complete len:203 (-),score=33.12 TRINITY_DN15206_c0_g3_i1:293-901(-)
MATTLATTLHAAFENNRALKLRADHFLIVLRALGTTVSADEGALLIRYLGPDSQGYVDVQKFCVWFEGMEQDPRFAQLLQSLGRSNGEDGEALPLAEANGGQSSGQGSLFVDGEGMDEVAELNDAGAVEEHDAEVSFRRYVSADDRSAWPLEDTDKYTLPQRRQLTEREALKARFNQSLNRLKARLKLARVTFRPGLTAQTI